MILAIEIFETVTDIINMITNSFISIYEFVTMVFDMIKSLISFIPEPFRTIILSFLVVIIAVFLWKLIKGGG